MRHPQIPTPNSEQYTVCHKEVFFIMEKTTHRKLLYDPRMLHIVYVMESQINPTGEK